MFSPYYAWARRRGQPDPLDHSALNVALYGGRGKRWAMTERRRTAVHRTPDTLVVGPSAVSWDGTSLTVRIDERTVPVPRRIRGSVRLHPTALVDHPVTLDADGLHRWSPLAPCARVEVDMEHPALRWSGSAYFDTNAGDVPLEDGFVRWHWSRAELREGTAILYDVTRRDGQASNLAIRVDPAGHVHPIPMSGAMSLPRTRWGIERATQTEGAHRPTVVRTLEDTPFYARSLVASHVLGEPVVAMHESLSLDRFRSLWIQWMLPFRMPRVWR